MSKPLSELINLDEPGWPLVQAWVAKATKPVEVLDTPPSRAKEVLLALQVTTRSPLGAIAFQTGGILVDSGWVRLFGGGCARLDGDLARWNGLGARPLVDQFDGATFVGDDALGGFFALDAGALGEGKGEAFYLAPDTLEWERLTDNYTALLAFLFTGDLSKFYADFRAEGWEAEVKALSPDEGWAFEPPLFSEAEPDVARKKTVLPMQELLRHNLHAADQLGDE